MAKVFVFVNIQNPINRRKLCAEVLIHIKELSASNGSILSNLRMFPTCSTESNVLCQLQKCQRPPRCQWRSLTTGPFLPTLNSVLLLSLRWFVEYFRYGPVPNTLHTFLSCTMLCRFSKDNFSIDTFLFLIFTTVDALQQRPAWYHVPLAGYHFVSANVFVSRSLFLVAFLCSSCVCIDIISVVTKLSSCSSVTSEPT